MLRISSDMLSSHCDGSRVGKLPTRPLARLRYGVIIATVALSLLPHSLTANGSVSSTTSPTPSSTLQTKTSTQPEMTSSSVAFSTTPAPTTPATTMSSSYVMPTTTPSALHLPSVPLNVSVAAFGSRGVRISWGLPLNTGYNCVSRAERAR